jgi:hypothetical protein
MTEAQTAHTLDNSYGNTMGNSEKASENGSFKDRIGNTVYDAAEDARHSIVKAIESAAEKLRGFKFEGTSKDHSYMAKVAGKLDHLSRSLGGKDALEIAEDVKGFAKKYRTPLLIGSAAIAYFIFRPGRDR